MTQLSDEILIAYSDGELGSDQIAVVEGVLEADAETLQQLRRLHPSRQRLMRAFQSMLQAEYRDKRAMQEKQEPPQPPAIAPAAERRRSVVMPVLAFGMLLLAAGTVVGFLAGRTPNDGTFDSFSNFFSDEDIAREQARAAGLIERAREPKITAAAPRRKAPIDEKWYEHLAKAHHDAADRLLDRFAGKTRNPELALFELPESDTPPPLVPVLSDDEMKFVGADTLAVGAETYTRLAYRDNSHNGVAVALYVGADAGGSLTLERGYVEEQNYVRWTQDKRSYLLIGPVPHWRLIVLAVAVQRQLVR